MRRSEDGCTVTSNFVPEHEIHELSAIALDRRHLPGQCARRRGAERHNQRRRDEIDLTLSHCSQASISRSDGFLWMRRLPRGSFLKCFTAFVT